MATFKINQDQQSQYNITGSNNTWIMKAGVVIESKGSGIFEAASLNHNTYVINGDTSGDGLLNAGLRLEGRHSTVEVSSVGKIFGDIAAIFTGDNASLINNGYIQGSGMGIEFRGDGSRLVNTGAIQGLNSSAVSIGKVDKFSLVNDGEITGFQAIVSDADNLTIKLGKHSDVSADDVAIRTLTAGDETAHIVNQGHHAANGNIFALAVEGGSGREVVRNSGTIEGSLSLGGGNDLFDGRHGSVSGIIAGGLGDDTYKLSSKADYVHEAAGEGFDTINVSFSYTLAGSEEIEKVMLVGEHDLTLHGNQSGSTLGGNAGDNRIFGEGGNDALAGFGGKDLLTGGDGADIFVFLPSSDKEIVTDFVNGVDKLSYIQGRAFESFDDLYKHHTEQHGSDLIISGDGTEMIIRNFSKADFDVTDFVF